MIASHLAKLANRFLPARLRRAARFAVVRTANALRHGDPFMFSSVTIETSTACNRKCSYCPVSLFPRKQATIQDDLLRRIGDQLRGLGYRGTLDFIHYNEPLLQPEEKLNAVAATLRRLVPKAFLTMTTNGDRLTPGRAGELIAIGVQQFNITRHPPHSAGWDQQINLVRKAYPGHVHLLASPGDEGWTNRGGLVDIPGENFLKPTEPCYAPEGLTVAINGDVLLCCNDFHKKHVMGNVQKQRLDEIWASYAPLRAQLRRAQWELPICKRCVGVS